ncbi:hypothetical protein EW146_g1448 [Bondarzewia mesenterica]|uniref:Uncharacterized protein n=1 Tax=Bondarzewia mesenterica TaxID=1095465 RepID=A0A4S4M483_9AGAM|nr:hypothetical protein EW146_g1448 [Bondarzewia mesenterica]
MSGRPARDVSTEICSSLPVINGSRLSRPEAWEPEAGSSESDAESSSIQRRGLKFLTTHSSDPYAQDNASAFQVTQFQVWTGNGDFHIDDVRSHSKDAAAVTIIPADGTDPDDTDPDDAHSCMISVNCEGPRDAGHVEGEAVGTWPDCKDTATTLMAFDYPVSRESSSDKEYLRSLSIVHTNVVIDPPNPAVAPYIVITPPPRDSLWEAYNAWFHNSVGQQCDGYLNVAPVSMQIERNPSQEFAVPIAQPTLPFQEETTNARIGLPVFSRSLFNRMTNVACMEYLDARKAKLLNALYRHCYKSSANSAAYRAYTFTANPSSALVSWLKSKPLSWTDPADALLLDMRRYLGVTIYESLTPCTTPHIAIVDEASANPWIAWSNGTLPQGSEDGKWLTVSLWYYGPSPEYVSLDEKLEECSYQPESRPETPVPVTPQMPVCTGQRALFGSHHGRPVQVDVHEVPDESPDGLSFEEGFRARAREHSEHCCDPLFFAPTDDFAQTRVYDIDLGDEEEVVCLRSAEPSPSFSSVSYSDVEGSSNPELYEDEEGLPPLDEWYTSIARRTSMTLVS